MTEIASQVEKQSQTNSLSGSGILQRKCACDAYTVAGGQCSGCEKDERNIRREAANRGKLASNISLSAIQRKLSIGANDDPLEKDADYVADQVISAPVNQSARVVSERIHRLAGRAAGLREAPSSVERVLARSGSELEPTLRHDMEQRFGYDFSQVRVHSAGGAEQSARDVNASAYTVGNNIVFGADQFAPTTREGRRLIAHELTHVLQQSQLAGIRFNHNRGPDVIEPQTHIALAGVAPTNKPRKVGSVSSHIVQMQRGSTVQSRCEEEAEELINGLDSHYQNAAARIAVARSTADVLVSESISSQDQLVAVCASLNHDIRQWGASVGYPVGAEEDSTIMENVVSGLTLAASFIPHPAAKAILKLYKAVKLGLTIHQWFTRSEVSEDQVDRARAQQTLGSLGSTTDTLLNVLLRETSSVSYQLGMTYGAMVQASGPSGFGVQEEDVTAERRLLESQCSLGRIAPPERERIDREERQLEGMASNIEALLEDVRSAAHTFSSTPSYVETEGRRALLLEQASYIRGHVTTFRGWERYTLSGVVEVRPGGTVYLRINRNLIFQGARSDDLPSPYEYGSEVTSRAFLADFAAVGIPIELSLSIIAADRIDTAELRAEPPGRILILAAGTGLSADISSAEILGRTIQSARDWSYRSAGTSPTFILDEERFRAGHSARVEMASALGAEAIAIILDVLHTRPLSRLRGISLDIPPSPIASE